MGLLLHVNLFISTGFTLNCSDFFSAALMSFVISTARLKITSAFVGSCFCVLSLCNSHENQSCYDFSRFPPNLQLVASLQSSATYSVIISSGACMISSVKVKSFSDNFFLVQNASLIWPPTQSCFVALLAIVGYATMHKCSLL